MPTWVRVYLAACNALVGDTDAAAVQAEAVVKEIRGWYNTVQNAKATSTKTIKFESDSEPLVGTPFGEAGQDLLGQGGVAPRVAEEARLAHRERVIQLVDLCRSLGVLLEKG